MTETRAVSIEDVRSLVVERQRFDDWLVALEARRAETPARVFDRVHGDYSARRGAVIDQLRTHVDALAAMASDLDTRLNTLEDGLATLEDERVEAMLRTAVGEFDHERWEQVRQDVEAKIAERSVERTALLADVDDVRTLLASARNDAAPVPVVPPAPEVDDAAAASPHDSSAGTSPTAMADAPASDVSASAATFAPAAESELTPLETIAIDPAHAEPADEALDIEDALALFTPAAPAGGHAAAPMGTGIDTRIDTRIDTSGIEVIGNNAAGSHAEADPFDDLAFLRSVIDPAGKDDGRSSAQAAGKVGPQGAATLTAAPASSTSSTASSASSGSSSEPQKTLRCTECGTMNLPTEWYCERCGGELAAF